MIEFDGSSYIITYQKAKSAFLTLAWLELYGIDCQMSRFPMGYFPDNAVRYRVKYRRRGDHCLDSYQKWDDYLHVQENLSANFRRDYTGLDCALETIRNLLVNPSNTICRMYNIPLMPSSLEELEMTLVLAGTFNESKKFRVPANLSHFVQFSYKNRVC